jgi:hypothetical protein
VETKAKAESKTIIKPESKKEAKPESSIKDKETDKKVSLFASRMETDDIVSRTQLRDQGRCRGRIRYVVSI